MNDVPEIREAAQDDAVKVIAFFQKIYGETDFMLFEAGEAVPSEQQQRKGIADGLQNRSGAMFLCECGSEKEVAGIAFGLRGVPKSQRHLLRLVLGIAREHWGKGIGTRLMQAIEAWAVAENIRRLELSVHDSNLRARALYLRLGFVPEGRKIGSLLIGGQERDELLMAKRLH